MEQQFPEVQKDRLIEIMEMIEANPSCHTQTSWHCETSHCFGGWAQIKSGRHADDSTVVRDARVWLGLTRYEAGRLFAGHNTRKALRMMVDEMCADGYGTGFDSDGFDRYGFDSDGFDSDGFDRYGFDRDGFNRAGYDRDGFDLDGLDRINNIKPL